MSWSWERDQLRASTEDRAVARTSSDDDWEIARRLLASLEDLEVRNNMGDALLRVLKDKLTIAIEALERCKGELNVTICAELGLDEVLAKVRP